VKKLNHKSGEQEDQFYLKFSSESFCGCEHFVALAEKTYERRGRAMKSSEPQIFLPGHLEKSTGFYKFDGLETDIYKSIWSERIILSYTHSPTRDIESV
jgi:hypothetical protein